MLKTLKIMALVLFATFIGYAVHVVEDNGAVKEIVDTLFDRDNPVENGVEYAADKAVDAKDAVVGLFR